MSVERLELPEHENAFVQRCVSEGRYGDANAVVLAGLRLLEKAQEAEGKRLERLRQEVQKGMDDLENGRYIDVHGPDGLQAFFDDINREADLILRNESVDVRAPEIQ